MAFIFSILFFLIYHLPLHLLIKKFLIIIIVRMKMNVERITLAVARLSIYFLGSFKSFLCNFYSKEKAIKIYTK